MTLRTYLITMFLATIICWAGWGYVVVAIDPIQSGLYGLGLFYLALFLAVSGTGAIFGFFVRFIALKQALVFHSVSDAFRQSFFFGFLVVAVLFLLSRQLFSWINIAFLVVGLSLLEYFLVSYRK
ncbi:MAG: hypothetical protein WCK11_00745 [Candidatus Falkowbacteria bacterium]